MSKGGSAPSEQTVVQTNLPDYAEPYFERLMERAEGLSLADYTPYGGQRLAGMDPMQTQSYDMLSGMAGQGLPYLGDAVGVTQGNIDRAGSMNFDPYQFSQYGNFQAGSATPFAGFSAADLGPERQFTGQEVQDYMSPYIENVLGDRMSNIRRQFDISQAGRDAEAVSAGAFGGSRHGVQQALAEEDLMRQLDQTYNQGLNEAYGQATGAFQADRAAQMDQRVQQASEYARVQEAQAQELARTQGISIEEARRVQQDQAGELARVQAAQAAEDAAAREAEFRALGFSSDEAARLAGYGQQEYSNQIQMAQLLEQAGKAQQAYEQAGLDISYEDFLRQQGYPESQLTMMSSILRGVPIAPSTTTTAYQPYNPLQEALGAGISTLGLYQGMTA